MKRIDPNAPAQWDSEDNRPGVVDIDYSMILDYVYSHDGNCVLHVEESAKAFAAWANGIWFEYHDGERGTTNKDILDGLLADWRGSVEG